MNELYHHGIKGQKWGVRRFQEKDGDWTDSGLKRRSQREGWGIKSSGKNKYEKMSYEEKTKLSTEKKLKYMTDKELERHLKRRKMETELVEYDYRKNVVNRERTDRILKIAGTIAIAAVGVAALTVGKEAIKSMGSKLGEIAANKIATAVEETKDAAKEAAREATKEAVTNTKTVAKEAAKTTTQNVINKTGHLTKEQQKVFREQSVAIGKQAIQNARKNGTITSNSELKEVGKQAAKEHMKKLVSSVL